MPIVKTRTTSKPGPSSSGRAASYDAWKLDDLKKRAKELGLQGYSKKRKSELIEALCHPAAR